MSILFLTSVFHIVSKEVKIKIFFSAIQTLLASEVGGRGGSGCEEASTVLCVGVGWDSRIVLLEEAPVRGVGFFSEGRKTHQRDDRTTFPPFERMIDSAIGCCWK